MSSNSEKPQAKGVIGAMATAQTNQASGSTADRRRSSSNTASAQKFAGLHNQKRNSQDAGAAARKQSFAEQTKPAGFLGGFFNSLTGRK